VAGSSKGTRREDEHEDERPARGGDEELSAVEAAEAGRRQITEMTGRSAEGVTSVKPSEEGWVVEVEVLEAHHVPSSSDTLAIYEVELDVDGALTSYRRIRRYARGRADGEAS
jgi:hypothetical protein